jgi:hypothetical protein
MIIMVAGLALACLAIWLAEREPAGKTPRRANETAIKAEAKLPETNSAVPAPIAATTVKTNPVPPAVTGILQDEIAALNSAPDAAAARRLLAKLRGDLTAMPTNAAVAKIREFLDSKADAPTHLGFKVAGNGFLTDAPTLRTFLLDELGRLDPAAAADYSKTILASMDSPDEWALALSNLGRGDTSDAGRSLLEEKTGEMIQYAPWQQNPSVGFLEAFDAAVYLGGTNLMPALSNLVKLQDNPAVAHAAYLALDRLVINNPAGTLAALEADPDLMQGREATRANYFARADVRDPQQRQILENYLLDPQISPAEINTFAGVYPSANFMISPNLLTQSPTLDHQALLSRDAESLNIAQAWLADPRFANLQPALTKITVRLQQFVRQAGSGQ